MEFSEDVVVLRVGTFREADCWVRFFSSTHGLLTGFAFGGRRSRRRFSGCLDPLSLVRFRVSQNKRREYYCLEEGILLDRFSSLKGDLNKLGMLSNCVRFIESLSLAPDGYVPIHLLLHQMLTTLDKLETVSWFLPVLFRAKITFTQGYQPELHACRHCGCSLDSLPRAIFSVHHGALYCPDCPAVGGQKIPMSRDTLQLLTILIQTGPEQWASWLPSPLVREQCALFIDAMIQCHLGLICNGNRFVRC